MANIQQAVRWMQAGFDVQRAAFGRKWWIGPYEPHRRNFAIASCDGLGHILSCEDLLANDWEIAYASPIRVKDFVEGWIPYETMEEARKFADGAGNLVQRWCEKCEKYVDEKDYDYSPNDECCLACRKLME